jgi:hypothetical protein
MSAPERRRPGGASAIRLTAEPEVVKTGALPVGATQAEVVADAVLSIQTASANLAVASESTATVVSEDPPHRQEEDRAKEQTSLQLRRSLKRRAQTAVLRTGGYEDGYRSFASLVEGALERELSRLEAEFNAGQPFPENEGGFRTGRPMGS